MDLDFLKVLTENFVLVVFLACLIIGYIIKTCVNKIPNKYIPSILAIFGAVLNVFVGGLSVDKIVYGAFMGLSSTGAHQAFVQFINNRNKKNDDIESN